MNPTIATKVKVLRAVPYTDPVNKCCTQMLPENDEDKQNTSRNLGMMTDGLKQTEIQVSIKRGAM